MLGTMTHLCGLEQVSFTLYLCRTTDGTILVTSGFHSFWKLKHYLYVEQQTEPLWFHHSVHSRLFILTGGILPDISLLWKPFDPIYMGRDCVIMSNCDAELYDEVCDFQKHFVCEA